MARRQRARARRHRTEYEDFAVRIAPEGSAGFVSRILWAPEGGGCAPFAPPFDACRLPSLLRDLERTIRGSGERRPRHLEAPPSAAVRRFDPREVGTRLFESLFHGDVGRAFALSQPRRGEPGLRIRLVIDPGQPGCAAVAALPWELLYDPSGRGYLGRLRRFPVVRFLEGPGAHRPQPVAGELRVLVAICSPRDLGDLDASAERSALLRWSGGRGVHVEVLDHATFDVVRTRLARGEFHVFHFCGHGGFLRGHGTLAFERADGTAEPIDAELLAAHLDDAPALRLAVLNACDSGKMPRRSGVDPFTGVAAALVRSAVPAVIGMQYPISDRAAARFAEALYAALAEGEPVDAAVAEGRLAILRDRGSLEWATPVLHLRVRDGRLFELASPAPRPRRWLVAAAALILLAAIAAGVWHAYRSAAPSSESPAGDRTAPRPAVPPVAECPAPDLLPGFAWIKIDPGFIDLPAEEPGGPVRRLAVDRPLCLGAFEVSWGELRTVLGVEAELPDEDPPPHDELPAYGVDWSRAQGFLERINAKHSNAPFRLPTGAEWEYAARAGSRSAYSFGNDPRELPLHGNCRSSGPLNDGYDYDPAPVGSYLANPFGLYDMHGNVSEWVSDPPESPDGYRVRRGGSYANVASSCTASSAPPVLGQRRNRDTGFRIVREVTAPVVGEVAAPGSGLPR